MVASSRIPVVCGVDIGSTNAKVIALDPSGAVVRRAVRATPRRVAVPSIDALELLAQIEQMILEVCADDLVVVAVCSAGVGEDGVLVDAAFEPLGPALAWFDPRRRGVLRELATTLPPVAGLDAADDAARTFVGWAWERRRGATDHAQTWVALADFPTAVWSRTGFLSDTLASRTGAWRSADRAWSDDRVAATLGRGELLPPVRRAGEVVGPVVSAALRAAGVLAPDAVAVAGGHDHPVAGWAVDRLVPGAVLDSMGTAEVVVAQVAARGLARRDHIDIAPGIVGAGTTLLRVEELARNVQWASQDPEVARSVRALLAGVERPEPVLDAGFFVPGARGGERPRYTLDAPRDARARASAVLGALAHLGREAVESVGRDAAQPFEVRLAGGWVRSSGWIEIKTAVNGRRSIPVLEPEVTAVGAALLAASAVGWHPDPELALGGFTSDVSSP